MIFFFYRILRLKVISDLLQESILYKGFYFLKYTSYLCTIWWWNVITLQGSFWGLSSIIWCSGSLGSCGSYIS